MVLGISGSGKKEGTQPAVVSHGSPRRISASPVESVQPQINRRVPRSTPTAAALHHTTFGALPTEEMTPDSELKQEADNSVAARDWNVFCSPSSLRIDAAAAAAMAEVVLGMQVPSHTVAGISNVVVKVKSKESLHTPTQSHTVPTQLSPGHPEAPLTRETTDQPALPHAATANLNANTPSPVVSATPRSARSNPKWRNRPSSASTTPFVDNYGGVNSAASVAEIVAKFEMAAVNDDQSPAAAARLKVQKKSPASCSAAPQSQPSRTSRTPRGDETQKLSPRSAAVSAAAEQEKLRSASASAVRAGSSASVLQLYPQNAVWDQDSATILREIHADSTVHGVTVGAVAVGAVAVGADSSPKSKTSAKPPARTPLKTSAADRFHSPVVSGPVVLLRPAAAVGLRLLWLHFVLSYFILFYFVLRLVAGCVQLPIPACRTLP